MSTLNDRYTSELREQLDYSATWLPTMNVVLGDVGRLVDHKFNRLTSLKDLGINYTSRHNTNTGLLKYSSSGDVSFSLKVAGKTPDVGSVLTKTDAGIKVSFASKHALVFQASDCTPTQITNQHALGKELLSRFRTNSWPRDYAVVTEVLTAERTVALISNASNASIEFKANMTTSLKNLNLVDAESNLNVTNSNNMGLQIIGAGQLTPLFKLSGIRKIWFQDPNYGRRRDAELDKPGKRAAGILGLLDCHTFENNTVE